MSWIITSYLALRNALQGKAQRRSRTWASELLERAESRAGTDPHAAQELRDAAYAYLRVVR